MLSWDVVKECGKRGEGKGGAMLFCVIPSSSERILTGRVMELRRERDYECPNGPGLSDSKILLPSFLFHGWAYAKKYNLLTRGTDFDCVWK